MNILSLFANIGVAEARINKEKFNIVVANEIDKQRAEIYRHLYPETEMVEGDIREKAVKTAIIKQSLAKNVDIIFATPPCQGMSTAGKMNKHDERNLLICDTIEIIHEIKPKYILIENVPGMLQTIIEVASKDFTIDEYIHGSLLEDYEIDRRIINMHDYNVPQSRERAIYLLTRRDVSKKWGFPDECDQRKTLYDAIGHLPILDPFIYDVSEEERVALLPNYAKRQEAALAISKWHKAPRHVKRQVHVMLRTPTGKSAFENPEQFLPRKKDGNVVRGYKNTYKRQEWDKPAFTITMYNRTISSQNNVHPGRKIGVDAEGFALYSDPRVLTIYEIMLCMGLPEDWDIPEHVSDGFIRSIIGEGLPPEFVKLVLNQIAS